MKRIKIIKRADLKLVLDRRETDRKKASPAAVKRRAVNVVAGWIDEYSRSSPKDARRAFADLFAAQKPAIG